MTRLVRLALAAVGAVASVLAADPKPARAQVPCDTLPNPIIVIGSATFEPTLKEFAVRLAGESPPTTIITVGVFTQSTSCGGVAGIVNATEFGGLPGRYYTRSGTTVATNSCTFSPGQAAHVAISEVFYESCPSVAQPRPADIADVLGPAQAMAFFIQNVNPPPVQYISYEEARIIYGCGVSADRSVANFFNNSTAVFCMDTTSGTQAAVARNLGLVESDLKAPICVRSASDAKMIFDLIHLPDPPCRPADTRCGPPAKSIGFANVAALDTTPKDLDNPLMLAFQARKQTRAFYPDSAPLVADRRNVRDGHYPIWGYVHFITRTSGGKLGPQAAELIGWLNGTKKSANVDYFSLEVARGFIPQCAMKVKRDADGGPLSPYTPAKACHCAFEAHSAQIIPPGCIPCASPSACSGGLTCQHGFCD